jgi:hypothetical protein
MIRRVYVAGAISADSHTEFLENIRKGLQWSIKVLKSGFSVFSPFLDYQFIIHDQGPEYLPVRALVDNSMAWLEVSDAVFVTPGWEESKGTKAEIARAEELGIPVVYRFRDLRNLAEVKKSVTNYS